jgi:CheY-like chemotaxis protein
LKIVLKVNHARGGLSDTPKRSPALYRRQRDVLECEKSFLESFGYCVLTAASGGKGLELASKHSVDVVILDYFMPEMNGQEVAIEMRRLRPQAPIIMLSGAVDVPEQASKSVDAFIAKDCLASQLLPTIAQLCGYASTSQPSCDA